MEDTQSQGAFTSFCAAYQIFETGVCLERELRSGFFAAHRAFNVDEKPEDGAVT